MIKGTNIYKRYDGNQILNGVNLELPSGTITVLIGASGSGKTTLLNSLALLEPPDNGEIQIAKYKYTFPKDKKKKVKHFDYIEGKQTLGIVFQDLHLLPHWTNYENIIKPLGNSFNEELQEKLNSLVKLFKMDKFLHNYPKKSSKGEEQRVAFVRALMLNPDYLLLDEITSALDPEIAAILLKYLISLRDSGKTILLITHFLVFAQNVADRIIFIDNGSILEQGDKNIFHSPSTKRLQNFLLSLSGVILNKTNAKISDIAYSMSAETHLSIPNDLISKFNKSKSIKEKIRLSYRILDYDVSDEIHESIYLMINNNWQVFRDDLLNWLGVKEHEYPEFWLDLIQYISERLNNSKYPKSKAWIYLLSIRTYEEYKSKLVFFENTLNKYKKANHFLVRRVSEDLLKELELHEK